MALLDVPKVVSSHLAAVVLTLLVFGYLLLLIAKALYNVFLNPIAIVPGPLGGRIFSSYMNMSQLRGERAQTLSKLHKTYGSLVRVGPNEVSLSDPKLYRPIYNSKTVQKTDTFYKGAIFLNHDNIFSMRNKKEHSARRKMQNPPYSQQSINSSIPFIAEKAAVIVQRMSASPGLPVNAFELCGLFSLEVICKCAFAYDWNDDNSRKILKAMDGSAAMLAISTTLPGLKEIGLQTGLGKYLPGVGTTFQHFETWVSMTTQMLTAFQANSSIKKDIYMGAPMLTAHDEFLGRQLNEVEILEEWLGLAFAGSGTTSTTLTYLLYALSRPGAEEMQERLRRELRDNSDEYNVVKDLPFLNAVIKETFRVYPTIISTLPRILGTKLVADNVELPAGTVVGMQNYVHHRDPELFPEPDRFQPDRWLGEKTKDMNDALTPFSVGSRNCIGQNLARAELYLATSTIFRSLRLSLNSSMKEGDMEMEDRFNVAPRGRKLLLDVEVLDIA